MKTNVSIYDFRDTIMELRPNNFSYEGLTILYDWFEQYEEDCETEVDFDPIGICCEFNESSLDDVMNDYGIDENDDLVRNCTSAVKADMIKEYLNENTMLCGVTESGNYVYAAF